MLCQDCNMRCSYCFAGNGEYNEKGYMNFKIGKKAIDFLIENSLSDDLTVCLFGGEPLLNSKLFIKMVNYCKYIEKEKGKKITITTTINGTLLTKEIEKFLIENNVRVQISLDGDKDTHNSNRYFSNKAQSYDKIMKNIDGMRKQGLLSARATVTRNNLDMIQIFNHLNDLNFRAVPFTPAFNLFNNNDLEDLKASYGELVVYFENLIKNGEINKAKKVTVLYSFIRKIYNARNRDISCGLGNSAIAVDINGDIYPCHRFVSDKRSIIGNIYDGFKRRQEFLESVNIENIDKCKKCWAKNLCIGGCPKEFKEDIENKDENKLDLCELHKFLYEKLIYLYLRLTKEEKEELFKR